MASSSKQSRAQLLIDLAIGNNVIINKDVTFLPSDEFISNGYNPTNTTSCNIYETFHSDESTSILDNITDEAPILFEELQDNQTELNHNLVHTLPTAIEPEPVSKSLNEPECIGSIAGYILNEITGEFTIDEDGINGYDDNYYLDENTGQFLLKDVINFEIEEDDCGFEFVDESEDNSKNRKKSKINRELGKKYIGRKRKLAENGEKPSYGFVEKPKKSLLEKPCKHSCTANSDRSFLCGLISETKRELIFKYFWSLSWDSKKAYLKNLVRLRPVQRRRKTRTENNSQKHLAFDYFFANDREELVRVCKKFLTYTLNIHPDTLLEWIKESQDMTSERAEDLRLKHQKRKAITNASFEQQPTDKTPKTNIVREWLGLLNKVPSHYCRSSTTRVYVEDTFESKSHMYRIYKEWCIENGKATANRKLFNKILDEQKISIFKPRKDQCDVCFARKEGNVSDEEYELHVVKKNEAYKAQIEAYAMSSSDVLVVTVDVQGVLLCPKLLVSAQYYKTKLQIHNYSIYINNNKDVHLYVWHEGNGGVTANEFTSCIVDFIKKQTGYKKICITSDGCSYQNRNKVISSALLTLSVHMKIEIEQIILEKGHTMMKVDSVHSTLERKFRPPIYAPCDYISKMTDARPNQPYKVNHLDFNFFKNYEECVCVDSIRPGKKSGDPTVNDLRALLYKDGAIFYKLRHTEDWKILPQRVRKIYTNQNPKQLYKEPCKIEKSKYECLQALKTFLHRDYHSFYDNLKH